MYYPKTKLILVGGVFTGVGKNQCSPNEPPKVSAQFTFNGRSSMKFCCSSSIPDEFLIIDLSCVKSTQAINGMNIIVIIVAINMR